MNLHTLDFQVKVNLLSVISIGNDDCVEALLLRPHPHQGESGHVPEAKRAWTKHKRFEGA